MSREYVLKSFRPAAELKIDYASELNTQQHAAVTATPGPALVIAGAGSGKTRTLTYRVAYLLEQGIPAERVLLLTFTNKAAREMMRRVAELLGDQCMSLWGGTFHSIGARILRRHADILGYRPDFTIMDRDDADGLIKTCVEAAGINVKEVRFPKAEVLGEVFSLALNTCRTIPDILRNEYDYSPMVITQVEKVCRLYTERKQAANVMDFDDLLVLWLKLMREHPEVREQYQRKFQFVLVDEYQDTNKLQSDLVELIAEQHQNLMVVGDDSQSIYAWRGANYQNILGFPKRYPKAKVYKIEVNYRSTPEILAVANAAISGNKNQFTKVLASARQSGIKPILVHCPDAHQQAAFIAQRMLELRDEGILLRDMAVLYRSHFHTMELQMELQRHNIPFSITSGIRFFEQAHIKDVTAYLKLLCNPRDELSFKRLILMFPGVGGKAAEKLWQAYYHEYNQTVSSSLAFAPSLQKITASVPKKAAREWSQFAALISDLEVPDLRNQPAAMIKLIVESGYEEYLKENYQNHRSRMEDLDQLATFARSFATLEDFLTQLSLLTNLEVEDGRKTKDDERVRLSTIHQAKGLEFDVVFVIMLCEGLFPSERSMEATEGEEEERRLFYVSVTRARNELYLSYPAVRFSNYGGDYFQQPSRFLEEIPRELVEEWNLKAGG